MAFLVTKALPYLGSNYSLTLQLLSTVFIMPIIKFRKFNQIEKRKLKLLHNRSKIYKSKIFCSTTYCKIEIPKISSLLKPQAYHETFNTLAEPQVQ